jgi:hypothetical protein
MKQHRHRKRQHVITQYVCMYVCMYVCIHIHTHRRCTCTPFTNRSKLIATFPKPKRLWCFACVYTHTQLPMDNHTSTQGTDYSAQGVQHAATLPRLKWRPAVDISVPLQLLGRTSRLLLAVDEFTKGVRDAGILMSVTSVDLVLVSRDNGSRSVDRTNMSVCVCVCSDLCARACMEGYKETHLFMHERVQNQYKLHSW